MFGDIPPPYFFADLFGVFIDLFYTCHEGITYPDLQSFMEAHQMRLSVYEVSLIRRMNSIAAHEINLAYREGS
jgi:hypothetical protein